MARFPILSRVIGFPSVPRRAASTSSTSTACRASSTIPKSCRPASGCSTTTTTATSMSTWCRGGCSGRASRSSRRRPLAAAAALKGRLYRNDLRVNADGTRTLRFTDVTDASGIDARSYGMGVAAGDFDNDGWVDLLPHELRHQPAVSQQRRRHVHRRVEAERHRRRRALERVGGVRRLRPRRLAGSLRRQLRATTARRTSTSCLSMAGARDYCPPQIYRGAAGPAVSQPAATARSPTSRATALVGGEFGPALGVVDRRLQRRRLDRHLRRQRRRGEPAVDQPARRHVREHGAAGRRGADRRRQGRSEHGRRRRRLRQRRRRGPVHDRADRTREPTCTSTTAPALFEDRQRAFGTRSVEPAVHRLRHRLVRLRQRRLARPADGERRDRRRHRGAGRQRERSVSAATSGSCCSATSATGGSRTSPAGPARCSSCRRSGRGAAFGDIDNDGDIDVLVGNDSGRVRLLINNIGSRQPLARPAAGRRAGRPRHARRAGRRSSRATAPTLWRRARADGSYASANDPRVLVGLGSSAAPATVRVRWPDGRFEEWPGVSIDRWTALKEGTGR